MIFFYGDVQTLQRSRTDFHTPTLAASTHAR
jgi:hypothetical protein